MERQCVSETSVNFQTVHSANCVACRRVLTSAPLQLIGSRPLVAIGNETYKLNLKQTKIQIQQLH
jgi:hypothetical protein